MAAMKPRTAVDYIREKGMCLVYPIRNSRELPNLWHAFFPRSHMNWEWDEGGDDRVARLWHLRAELAVRDDVVYSKLFQNRATFCSPAVFEALYRLFNDDDPAQRRLSPHARQALDELRDNSPRSTKALRKELGLGGKLFESSWTKAMKELWQRLLIVGRGEVDDGAFPSLAVGASDLLFEGLVRRAAEIPDRTAAWKRLTAELGGDSPFLKHFAKQLRSRLDASPS